MNAALLRSCRPGSPAGEFLKGGEERAGFKRTVKALVAVRSGSVRVQNKNVRPFCGSTLLELRVAQLLAIKELSGVVVNSNDPRMLERAANLGASTVLRDPQFASNTVSMSDVYVNMAEAMDCTDILYANVTNPLVKSESYGRAIESYLQLDPAHDSLASVCPVKEFLWLDGRPINYDPAHQPRSQDLPDLCKLTFAISIIPRQLMIERKNVIGFRPKLFVMDEVESLDIDTPLDFFVAEQLYHRMVLDREAVLA
jgi:CMP-N,N'-diacetyllegionaminic acid synthase